MKSPLLWSSLAVMAAASCTTYTPRTDPGAVSFVKPPDPIDAVDPALADPRRIARDSFGTFIQGLQQDIGEGVIVGFLPLASQSLRGQALSVSELSMLIPDELGRMLESDGVRRTVLTPRDMETRIAEANVARKDVLTRSGAELRAERLGVDVLVIGEIRRTDNVGRSGRHELQIDLSAIDVEGKRSLGRPSPQTFASDRNENFRMFDMASRDGAWMSDGKWEVPEQARTFDRELGLAARVLGRRAAAACARAGGRGAVYLAPTDTGHVVQQLAYLRAAQGAYHAELRRRSEAAVRSGGQVDMSGAVTLVDATFENMQAAEAFLMHLEEAARATPAMRFGQQITGRIRDALSPDIVGREVRDFGFAASSNTQRASSVLATEGLARHSDARDALIAEGIGIVLAPRLDRVGTNWVLRVELLDLEAKTTAPAKSFTLAAEFSSAIVAELGLEDIGVIAPIRDVVAERTQSWERVFANAENSVVYLQGTHGAGTGFLASREGHIVTSSETAQALGSEKFVYFADRSKHACTVLTDDALWDVAILKIDAPPSNARPLTFADDAAAKAGVGVAVLGHPLGTSGWVISPGYLSSASETVDRAAGTRQALLYNCATRSGNSGSPVLLADGRVLGVHSHGLPGEGRERYNPEAYTGFAFASPAARAKAILESTFSR